MLPLLLSLILLLLQGDGACNFRRWLDDSPKSTLNIPEDAAAEQNILLDEFNLSYEEPMPIDVLELGAHEPPSERVQMRMEGSGRNKMTDRADEPSKEIHSHAAQNNDPQVTLDSEMTNQNMAEDHSAMKNTPESITTVAALHKRSVLSILLFMLTLVLTSYLSTTKCPDPLIDMLQFLRGHVLPRPGSPGQVVDSPQGVTISAMRPVIKGKSSCVESSLIFNTCTRTPPPAPAPAPPPPTVFFFSLLSQGWCFHFERYFPQHCSSYHA